MTATIIGMLIFSVLLALIVILVLASILGEHGVDANAELDVRRAERRIHDIASRTFQAMLDTARDHDPRAVK